MLPTYFMSRQLRHFEPGSVLEITTRTIHGRYLLRPSKKLNRLVVGVLARAAAMYGVSLHVFTFVSNHYHLILTIPNVATLARFMNYVNSNIAKEVGRLHNWKDKFWSRRYSSIEVLDDDAQIERLEYLLSHGCKEGLVADPRDWPGATCVDALLEGKPVRGVWIDRTALWSARRRGKEVAESDHAKDVVLHLTPLPCWKKLDEQEQQQRVRQMLKAIAVQTKKDNRKLGRKPLGAKKVLAASPHFCPDSPKKSPAPRCHTTCPERWAEFLVRTRMFVDEYREAATQWLAGKTDVVFPAHCFPPPLTYASRDESALVPS